MTNMPRRQTLLAWIPFLLSMLALIALRLEISAEPPIKGSMFRDSLFMVSLLPVYLFVIPVMGLFYRWVCRRFITALPVPPPMPMPPPPLPPELLRALMRGMPPMPMSDVPVGDMPADQDAGADGTNPPVFLLIIEEIEIVPYPLQPARRGSTFKSILDGVVSVLVAIMLVLFAAMLVKGFFDPATKRDYVLACVYVMFQLAIGVGVVIARRWQTRQTNRTPPARVA